MRIEINNQEKGLILLSILSVLLSLGKVVHSGYITFLSLSWNLLLAWIPYLISRNGFKATLNNSARNIIFILLWIIFLPNAPYLITDFIHLNTRGNYRWLEIIIFSSYALNGLLLFQFSIIHFKQKFSNRYPSIINQLIVIALSGICAYGIYVGRVLRCNSWEVITDPIGLAHAVFNSFFHNPNILGALYINAVFTLFLYISIMVFDYLLKTTNEKKN